MFCNLCIVALETEKQLVGLYVTLNLFLLNDNNDNNNKNNSNNNNNNSKSKLEVN